MPVLQSIKDIVVGQALKLAGSPRITKLVSDPRIMNAAMKAISVGGTVKTGVDKAAQLAAGAMGLATQAEVSSLRSTVQQLEEQIAHMEKSPKGPS